MKTSLLRIFLVVASCIAIHTAIPARADTNFGNTYLNGSSGSSAINTTSMWRDLRFTATDTLDVDRFAVTLQSSAGNPQFMVSLYSDNSGNLGSLLVSKVFTPGTLGQVNFYGDFGTNISLTKGSVYHAVMRVTNGSGTDLVTLRHLSGSDFSHSPTTGGLDPSLNNRASTTSGNTWTDQAYQTNGTMLTFALGNANGDAIGQPVGGGFGTFGVGSTSTKGQHFLWEGATGDAVTSITLRVSKGAGNAADNLNVFLLDSSLHVLSSNLFLNSGFANATASNYTINLGAPLSLTNGAGYNLVLQSAGSTANSYVFAAPFVNLTNMYDASFQGTNGFAISGTGLSSFTNATQTAGYVYDMWFNLGIATVLPIPEPATLAICLLGLGTLALRRRARA